MDILTQMIDFIIHIDVHLAEIIKDYGLWTYLILALIIFCETGLVVTPFLPGDSLLFVIGALGATGTLDIRLAFVILVVAALGGNTLNYLIGKTVGLKILGRNKKGIIKKIIKKEYIEKTHAFYKKHGGKAVLISRFLPILRTFAPFVAGVGEMSLGKFTFYNTIGGTMWVVLFMAGGYFFGNIPLVKNNFTYVIFAIIAFSLLPAIITGMNARKGKMGSAG